MTRYAHEVEGQYLSRRQTEVVQAFAAGCVTYDQVAQRIGCSVEAAQQAGARAQNKIGADSLVHLAFMICGRVPKPWNLRVALGELSAEEAQ